MRTYKIFYSCFHQSEALTQESFCSGTFYLDLYLSTYLNSFTSCRVFNGTSDDETSSAVLIHKVQHQAKQLQLSVQLTVDNIHLSACNQ